MDGPSGGGTTGFVGVDGECLDTTGQVTKKDYIAIPFAEALLVSTNTRYYHSLFCSKSLDGNELTCKIRQ